MFCIRQSQLTRASSGHSMQVRIYVCAWFILWGGGGGGGGELLDVFESGEDSRVVHICTTRVCAPMSIVTVTAVSTTCLPRTKRHYNSSRSSPDGAASADSVPASSLSSYFKSNLVAAFSLMKLVSPARVRSPSKSMAAQHAESQRLAKPQHLAALPKKLVAGRGQGGL